MNAPWVCDMREMTRMDEAEERDYAIERLATHIAGDPDTLKSAICDADEESATMANLATALSAIWQAGEQATPEQSLVISACVQAIADDAAKAIYDRVEA